MTFQLLFHRFRWLHAPSALLVLLLQRIPVLRLLATASPGFGLQSGELIKSAFALAALGAYNSVAGATTINAAKVAPTAVTPVSATVGKTFTVTGGVGDAFGLSFTGSGAPGAVRSWKVTGTLPPGVAVTGGAAGGGGVIVNGLKLTFAGTPTAAGSYTLAVAAYENSNAGGRSAGITCQVSISGSSLPVAPGFTVRPLSQTVIAGGSVTFTATVAGSPAPTLQWFKGDTALAGKTSASLVLANVQPADAGDYTLVATNSAAPAGVSSPPATLTVQVPPTILAAPAADVVSNLGEMLTLSVSAAGTPAPVFQWRKGVVDLPGQTGPDLVLGPLAFADAGDYTLVVANAAGSRSVVTRLAVAVPPPVALVDPGTLKTGAAVTFDLSGGRPVPAGLTFAATGLPAGLVLDPATGRISGVITAKAGVAKVVASTRVGAIKGPSTTATLKIGAFPPALVGAYEVLLQTEGEASLPAGKLGVTVSATGAFTGTLLTDDLASHSVKGSLVLGADHTSASATLTVARTAPLPAHALEFTISADALAATLALDGVLISGGADGVRLLSAAPAGAASAYTALFTAPANLGTVVEYPLGFGHATASINAKGVLALAGKYADGTKLTGSVALGADHVARLYLKPYKLVGGYLAAALPFTPRADAPGRWHVAPADGSDVYWRKPAPAAATTSYADGFGPLALAVRIEPWTKPTAALTSASLLGLGAGGDVGLDLAATGVANAVGDPYGLPVALRFDPVKNTFVVAGANAAAFTAKLTPATGALSGAFTLKAIPPLSLRKIAFTGVALQSAPADRPGLVAGGFFLLPAAVKGGPVLSGRVVLATP